MTSPVPPWKVVKPSGEVVNPAKPGEHPTRYVSEPGSLLAIQRAGQVILVAPSAGSRIDWLTTVDQRCNDGATVRRIGPGIVSGAPVRLWCSPSGPLVLTDGPVEQAHGALERFRRAVDEEE